MLKRIAVFVFVVLTLNVYLFGQNVPLANHCDFPIKEEIKTGSGSGWGFLEWAGYPDHRNPVYHVYHPGWDINVAGTGGDDDLGTKIYPIADGVVEVANKNANNEPINNSWGALLIKHNIGGKIYYSQYGHVRKIFVKVGDQAKCGKTVIAEMGGCSGMQSSKKILIDAHLHFEIRNSNHPDPTKANYWNKNALAVKSNVESWYENPEQFILAHQNPLPTTSRPGYFYKDGKEYWHPVYSPMILKCYNSKDHENKTGYARFGNPVSHNGGGAPAHVVNYRDVDANDAVIIQDFSRNKLISINKEQGKAHGARGGICFLYRDNYLDRWAYEEESTLKYYGSEYGSIGDDIANQVFVLPYKEGRVLLGFNFQEPDPKRRLRRFKIARLTIDKTAHNGKKLFKFIGNDRNNEPVFRDFPIFGDNTCPLSCLLDIGQYELRLKKANGEWDGLTFTFVGTEGNHQFADPGSDPDPPPDDPPPDDPPPNPNDPRIRTPVFINFADNADIMSVFMINELGKGTGWFVEYPDWISRVSPAEGFLAQDRTQYLLAHLDRSKLNSGENIGKLRIIHETGKKTLELKATGTNSQNVPAKLFLTRSSVSFGTDKVQTFFDVKNHGTEPLTWNATVNKTWLEFVSANSGTIPGRGLQRVFVEIDRSKLIHGGNNGQINIWSNGGNNSMLLNAHRGLFNSPDHPVIAVSTDYLDFDSTKTEIRLRLQNVGIRTMSWKLSTNRDWINISQTSGTGNDAIVYISADRSSLIPSRNYGGLILASDGNTTIRIIIFLQTKAPVPKKPGYFSDGWHDEVSIKFKECYDKNKDEWGLEDPDDYIDFFRNTDILAQEYSNGWRGRDYTVAHNSRQKKCHLFRGGMRWLWHDSGYKNGPPTEREFSMTYQERIYGRHGDQFAAQGLEDGSTMIFNFRTYGLFIVSPGNIILPKERLPSNEDYDWEKFESSSDPPKFFILNQNYPNPFNPETSPETTICFKVPENAKVKICVFNILGQEIKILADREFRAGTHEVIWNGRDERESIVPTGLYFYRMTAGEFVKTKKMILN